MRYCSVSFPSPMYEAATRNLRTAERFLLDPPLSAQFGGSAASVTDISVKGARFRHSHPMEMGQKSVLQLSIEGRQQTATIEAVVVWTKADPSGKARFVSGLRTYADASLIDDVLDHLRLSHRTTRIEEMRSTDRFDVLTPIEGRWSGQQVLIENLSARGARIETMRRLVAGSDGQLTFDVPGSNVSVSVNANVAWSAMKSVDPSTFRNGIFIDEKPELLRLAIGQLCQDGRASLDTISLGLKLKVIRARARQLAPSYKSVETAGVPVEQYVLIQCVREELRLNPDEAMHWYRRARLTISDPATRSTAPAIANHPDALAVWEYLDRSIDPSIIGRTFELP